MKKRYVLSAVGALGAGVAGYYLKDEQNRNKIKEAANVVASKFKQNSHSDDHDHTFESSGVPDQLEEKDLEQLENSKMVSEGSQFGVQYYNEKKEENTSRNQEEI
ncbi:MULTISPECIES: hypothetical protein [Oceanobacillus]|uniref:YtxH domain-containing protein n=1 Tax=Oceanobacillus profundus TaxID=372463 RepID=A0A417YKP4_9BACI|nr:hypothetical protein [Oceanobacillus profundus]MBR3119995.1 hypothetical protein [Oceanobacillus sp.]MCM3397002.1 hypothetical protein [Oceanobacillus profundus]RHW33781.1 hypothetical protein D1B32_06970 [Oceanobacillus profundus]